MISIDEINKLKAENAKLNAIIDGYQPRLQALKASKDKYYQQTLDDEIQINELFIFEQIEIGNWNEERLHQMIKFKVVKIKTNKPDVEMIKEQTNEQ